jgi:hypothetical protein
MVKKNIVSDFVAMEWFNRYKKEMSKEEYKQYGASFKKNTIVYKATWKKDDDAPEKLPFGIKVYKATEIGV